MRCQNDNFIYLFIYLIFSNYWGAKALPSPPGSAVPEVVRELFFRFLFDFTQFSV